MKILLFTRNEIGGALTYVLNFSKYLKTINVEHLVILYESTSLIYDSEIKEGDILKLMMSKYSSKKSLYNKFKKHINFNDVLILNDTEEIEFINYFQIKNKSIYILHGDIKHYQGYLQKYFTSFDDVFCVSLYLQVKYRKKYPCHSFSIAYPMVSDYPISQKFTVETPIKIASIGRFEFLKGSDTIVNSIKILKANKLSFVWTLFIPSFKNDEKLLQDIEDLVIVKRGFENNEVLNSIKNMDVLFFPSRSEGFGMSMIESLKRGLVVVSRDIPSVSEIITNNVNGFICKDEFEFISAIRRIIEKPDEIILMKSNANKLANQDFGYDSLCKRLYNLVVSTDISYNKKFVKVELPDPILPEYVLRAFRYIKYNFTWH